MTSDAMEPPPTDKAWIEMEGVAKESNVPRIVYPAFLLGIVVLLLLVVLSVYLQAQERRWEDQGGIRTGPVVTPSPYGPPDGNQLRTPDRGLRPTIERIVE